MQPKPQVNGNGKGPIRMPAINAPGEGAYNLMAAPPLDAAEATVVARIREFKNPNETWWQNLADVADYPLDKLGDLAFENRFGDRLDPIVLGAARGLSRLASSTVRPTKLLGAYKKRGIGIDELGDIRHLELSEINETIGALATKYQSIGAALGAATGAFGPIAAALDVSLLLALSLRAIDEYATYFGFSIEQPAERDYAVLVLATASTVTDGGRQQALAEVTRVGKALARSSPVARQRRLTSDLLKRITQAVVIRMLKGRVAKLIPGSGPIIGGGYDSLFLKETCKTAYMLYAERWLMRKYGPAVAVETGAPF